MNEKNFANRINKRENRKNESAEQEAVEINNKDEEEFESLTQEEKERREEIRKKLVSAINEVLKQDGFKKQASTWRRETKDVDGKEVIQVVNLQRGEYAFKYFLNIGILKKELNPGNKKPACDECDFDERFEYISKENKDNEEEYQKQAREKRNILNFEDASDVDVEEKIAKIKEVMQDEILPFFSDFDPDEA